MHFCVDIASLHNYILSVTVAYYLLPPKETHVENQLTASVRLEPDVNEAINEHLQSLPTPPRKQAFINSLLRLALTMKRIPVVGATSDVTKKFNKPQSR